MPPIASTIAGARSALLSAETNCGTSAVQNRPTFTLSRSLATPRLNAAADERCARAAVASGASAFPRAAARSAWTPSTSR